MAYLDAATRRRQFIEAARRAMEKNGVPNASLRTVAAEAGVSLATMQYVFPSKAELLRAVIEDVVEEIAGVLVAAGEDQPGIESAIRHGLATFWETLVSGGRERQLLQYELVLYSLRAPDAAELARLQYQRYLEVVAEWGRRASEESGRPLDRDLEQVARLVVAGVDGLIVQYLCAPDDRRARRDLDALADVLVGWLGAPQ